MCGASSRPYSCCPAGSSGGMPLRGEGPPPLQGLLPSALKLSRCAAAHAPLPAAPHTAAVLAKKSGSFPASSSCCRRSRRVSSSLRLCACVNQCVRASVLACVNGHIDMRACACMCTGMTWLHARGALPGWWLAAGSRVRVRASSPYVSPPSTSTTTQQLPHSAVHACTAPAMQPGSVLAADARNRLQPRTWEAACSPLPPPPPPAPITTPDHATHTQPPDSSTSHARPPTRRTAC